MDSNGLEVYVMCKIPSNVALSKEDPFTFAESSSYSVVIPSKCSSCSSASAFVL